MITIKLWSRMHEFHIYEWLNFSFSKGLDRFVEPVKFLIFST